MKTLFNTMTYNELSELSLFSWPDVSEIFGARGSRHTHPAALSREIDVRAFSALGHHT